MHALLLICLVLTGAAFADRVSITDLPLGERELIGTAGGSALVARLGATGELISLLDREENLLLGSPGGDWTGKRAAVEVLNPAKPTTRLFPQEKTTVRMDELSPTRTDVVVSHPEGLTLRYLMEPARLGIRVEGPGPRYLLRGRYPCRAEGARIVAADAAYFPTAGLGKIAGSPQLVVDGQRSRATELTAPEGAALAWTLTQTDGWAWVQESLAWQVEIAPGTTVWVASVPAPRLDGPVKFGLYKRRNSRPEGAPAAVAELSSARLAPDQPATLTLSHPLEKVLPDGRLLAALFSTAPDDPIERSEQGAWFTRLDRSAAKMQPVAVARGEGGWSLKVPTTLARGAYRLRVWLVPQSAPLPEALGGAKGAVVGYFPGFQGRWTTQVTPHPLGDVLVTVTPSPAPTLTLHSPGGRTSFWRGETIPLAVVVREPAARAEVEFTVQPLPEGTPPVGRGTTSIPLLDGGGSAEVALSTRTLTPGEYVVGASTAGSVRATYRFTIAPPLASGMLNINSPLHGPRDLAAHTRLGVSAWAEVMPGHALFAPGWPTAAGSARGLYASEQALPIAPPPAPSIHDALTRENLLFLQGVQTRQISFGLHHTIPEHVDETLRKHLVFAQFGRRFPSTLGLVFDYDVCGTGPGYPFSAPYVAAGKGKMTLLNARWERYWAEAKAAGATEADKSRLQTHFHAGIMADLYAQSGHNLRAALPEQRHTSAVTADHAYLKDGQYLPQIYAPLDLRYLEAWNDQIYANGAHDMQESFWAALLRMEQRPGQPIWLTQPTAPQPGTHFRRALESISHGANSVGYNAEGSAGLAGGWGADPLETSPRTALESLSGTLARRYGTWLNQFTPAEEIAILYSASQGGTNFGQSSPIFFAYFTLAQLNRPARLLTEAEIAGGKLSDVKALLVVGQTAKLPPATVAAIGAFAAAGGKVLCDGATKVELPGAVKLAEVSWPGNLWPQGCNTYHRTLMGFPRKVGTALTGALGEIGRAPLAPADDGALVKTMRAGAARLVVVTNNRDYPFDTLFTDEQRLSTFFRTFTVRGGIYYKDVRVPQFVTLRLRPDLAAAPPRIYDVFAGRELPVTRQGQEATVTVDLASLSGRVLLLTDAPLPAPQVSASSATPDEPLVMLVVKSPLPLPVRIRVNDQEFYRAATPAGSCDTLALRGKIPSTIEVTELISGVTQRATITPKTAATAPIRALPPVQIWDAPRLRAVLNAKGLAIYVDPRQADQLALATTLAKRLTADVVFNPPISDYPVAWDSPAEEEAAKEAIRTQGLLAWRRLLPATQQWTGALVPAAAWNRPVLLFGTAQTNRLLADLDRGPLLARPAAGPIGPGRAFVQPVAAPFWHGQDAAVVLCDDERMLPVVFEKLMALAAGKAIGESFSLADDGGARAERRRVLGFEPQVYPAKTVPFAVTKTQEPPGLPAVLPVAALAVIEEGVLAAVMSPGQNLARLGGATLKPAWRTMSAGYYQPTDLHANPAGESIVSDGTFVWRHDANGKLRWKSLAAPCGAPQADGSVWLRVGNTLQQVSATGAITARVPFTGTLVAWTPDLSVLFLRQAGARDRTKADATLVAVERATGRELWRVPNLDPAEVRLSADGSTLACIEHEHLAGRDDLDRGDASRLTALDANTGAIRLRHPLGIGMERLLVTRDGSRLLACEAGYSATGFLADVATGVVRRFMLPAAAPWALVLSADDRQLWCAGEALHRISLETLAPAGVCAVERFVVLAPKADGGVYAGSAERARVVEFSPDGKAVRSIALADGVAPAELPAAMTALREAPLVGSPSCKPNEIGRPIPLGPEYSSSAEVITLRADAVFPVSVAVRIPAEGRYRFVVELGLSKDKGDAIAPLRFKRDGHDLGVTAPLDGDKWQQAIDVPLTPGVYTFAIAPVPPWQGGWKQDAPVKSLTVTAVK
jgi:hypothetical protein